MLTWILSVVACHLISDVKLYGLNVTVCVVASLILIESFSCCLNTNNSEKANSCCWEEGSLCHWPGAAGMGELLSHPLHRLLDPQRRAAFLTNTIALAFAFRESNKPRGGWDERSRSGSMRRRRKHLGGVQEGFTLPSIAREEGCSAASAAKWRALGAGELEG